MCKSHVICNFLILSVYGLWVRAVWKAYDEKKDTLEMAAEVWASVCCYLFLKYDRVLILKLIAFTQLQQLYELSRKYMHRFMFPLINISVLFTCAYTDVHYKCYSKGILSYMEWDFIHFPVFALQCRNPVLISTSETLKICQYSVICLK